MLLTESQNPLSSILLRSKLSDARIRAFFSQGLHLFTGGKLFVVVKPH
jgi:hypothetical protein